MSFYESLDPRFERFVLFNAPLKKLATGFDWAEGPVWIGDAGCLLFSDIPSNRILRWTPEGGISTYRAPSISGKPRNAAFVCRPTFRISPTG